MKLPHFALRRGAILAISLLMVLALAACGETPSTGGDNGDNTGGGTVSVSNGTVEISADDLAFDANVIQAPAGEPFTITFTNNDSMPHNISVYTEEGGDTIVQGDVIGMGETVEVEVPALDEGEYFFVCDVHPQEMTGTVVVGG